MATFTPEQLAQIAALERGPYGVTEPSARAFNVYSGSSPTSPQAAQFQLGDYVTRMKERGLRGYNNMIAKAPGAYEAAVKNARNAGLTSRNVGGAGAALLGAGTAYTQFNEDQPVGAIASIPGSIIGAAGMSQLVKGIPGPVGAIARIAAPIAGSVGLGNLFAMGAEAGKNFITGEQTGKKPETAKLGPPVSVAGIPLNDSARALALNRALREQEFSLDNKQNASDIAFSQQINQYAIQNQLQLMKSQMPYITKLKNDDLVRSQALLNTQGNVDARLGMLATQGALAKGAQAEAGAFARTAISTNPYANAATRQSPNIQFG